MDLRRFWELAAEVDALAREAAARRWTMAGRLRTLLRGLRRGRGRPGRPEDHDPRLAADRLEIAREVMAELAAEHASPVPQDYTVTELLEMLARKLESPNAAL